MDLQLKGKRAVVTGATKGIGLRIAQAFADEGASVAICARTRADVDRTVAELQARGVKAIGDALDVMDRDAYVGWLDSAAARLGGVDAFVSNVTGYSHGTTEEEWRKGFDGDILAAVRGCETLMPHLKKSGTGSIVLIASVSALISKALPGSEAYGACKAALIAYGAMLSRVVARDGVRVNTVTPGPIYFEGGVWDRIRQRAPEMFREIAATCAVGRHGRPEEVAAAVLFLASPVSSFTVGQNLCVDGGFTSHIDY
jgi:3-oxoacyl-[acyl-carrier protein] reductase